MRSADDADEAIQQVLRSLADSATRSNLARAEVIAEALAEADGGGLHEARRAAAAEAAHQVVGSAGTFGQERASTVAAWLEAYFRAADRTRSGGAELAEARVRLACLRRELGGAYVPAHTEEE